MHLKNSGKIKLLIKGGGGGGGSPLKFWKTRFRDNGWPKRYTQWAKFLVGFVAQKPYGAAVVATPIFRPKWVHFWRFLAFWAPKIFGDLNQNSVNKISAKSSYLAILKISCKNIEKWRRSRKKCKVHFCKIANWDIGDFGDFWGLFGTRIHILTVIWSTLAHNT